MNTARIEQLLEFLKNDPGDTFTIYALGLEYLSNDDKRALEYFQRLLDDHDDYLPSYYQAAVLLIEAERLPEAKSVLEKGIILAKSQANTQTEKELRNLLQNLVMEDL